MQPPGNVGSEPVETSQKNKSSKAVAATEGTSKSTKAQDFLAKQTAEAAKTTLPPLAEKSSKLLKVNENLIRCKAEAAKVAAAEREKKKIHDSSPVTELEKKTILEKRVSSTSEQEKHVVTEEARPEDVEPTGKRARTDPIAEMDEEIDIFSTPQIDPSTRYPPKGKELEVTKELPVISSTDPEELEE
jgi:hypothetical protein